MEICQKSISNWGLIVLCEDLETCAKLSNDFAPEPLELLIENPKEFSINLPRDKASIAYDAQVKKLQSFYNVFENEAATRLLFFRVGTEYHSLLKTFLVFLNRMPEQVNEHLYSSNISMDEKIIEILRNLK